jgi:hypothetical protein
VRIFLTSAFGAGTPHIERATTPTSKAIPKITQSNFIVIDIFQELPLASTVAVYDNINRR